MLEYENQDDSQFLLSKLEERIISLGLNYDETNRDEYISFSNTDSKRSKLKQLADNIKKIFETNTKTSNSDKQIVKFHINSKEPKAVEILLQRMFNNEFDITDEVI